MKNTLKAFIVTFCKMGDPNDVMRSVVVIAYSKKEAGDLFITWALGKNIYNVIEGVVVQRTRKTKKNAHMLTEEYYKRQCDFVNKLSMEA